MKVDNPWACSYDEGNLNLSAQIELVKKLIHSLRAECKQIPMETAKLQTLEEIDNNYKKLEQLKKQVSETDGTNDAALKLLRSQQMICDKYNIYYKTCKRDLQRQKLLLDKLNHQKTKLAEAEKLLEKLEAQLSAVNNN